MNTPEVLYEAADQMERRGWASGSGWGGDGSSPVCTEGAIAAAMGVAGGVGYRCAAYDAVREYLDNDLPLWWWNDSLRSPHFLDVCREQRGESGEMDHPAAWLEADRRAALDAVATLRAAAVVEAARESAPASVEVSS